MRSPVSTPGGHLDREGLLLLHPAPAAAVGTGLLDDLALAPALGAGLLDGEEALLHPHLADAVTGGAGLGLGPGLGAGAAAELALHQGGDADLDLLARDRVLESEAEVITQVGTRARAAAAAAAEDVAEDIAEDVLETRPRKVSGAAETAARLDPGVAELVVGGAFLGVRENLVGQLGLLELGLGRRLAGIAVRVVLHGEPPVGLLDVGLAGVARHPQDLVIIAFGHGIGYQLSALSVQPAAANPSGPPGAGLGAGSDCMTADR